MLTGYTDRRGAVTTRKTGRVNRSDLLAKFFKKFSDSKNGEKKKR